MTLSPNVYSVELSTLLLKGSGFLCGARAQRNRPLRSIADFLQRRKTVPFVTGSKIAMNDFPSLPQRCTAQKADLI